MPKYWWMGLSEDEYAVLSNLEAASNIFNFIVIESILPIVRALLLIYDSSDRAIEKASKSALVMILQYFSTYFSKQLLNRRNDLHRMLGYD